MLAPRFRHDRVVDGLADRRLLCVRRKIEKDELSEDSGQRSAIRNRDACLGQEEHDHDRFEQFGTEFDSEPFANRERVPGA